MKTLLALASVLAFSATVQAGSISYDFRGDSNSTDYNDAAGKPDFSKFYFKTGRIDFKGKLNDSVGYQVRWAYTKDIATTRRDSAGSAIELAYITHKMSDMFTLSLGKFNTEIGGFEAATAGPDLYLTSGIYNHTSAVALVGKNESTNGLLYNTGLKAAFSFEDQTVSLIATNNISDAVSGTDLNQNRGLLGLAWKGAFMEKALGVMVSYHQVSPQTTATTTYNAKDLHTFISGGVKWDSDPYVVSLEYLTTSFKDDALSQTDTLNSIVAKLVYKMGMFSPRLELTSSEEKKEIGGTATNKYSGVGAVLEYKPTEDNFRYHVAYAMYADKIDGSTSDKTRQEIVIGARMLGDFLK